VITTAELHQFAAEEELRFDQVEKDYVLLWILAGLSRLQPLTKGWVFKGGTCLRHCYYPGYRFSEDLDFSFRLESGGLEAAQDALRQITVWVQENSGIRMTAKKPRTVPGDFQVEIAVEYSRGGQRVRSLPSVKIHLTFDEPILTEPNSCHVEPRYTDLTSYQTTAYSKSEILAEKMRSLLQQQRKWPRPRDLYDLWFILCHLKEKFDGNELKELFEKKCEVRRIEPDSKGLISENLKEWNKNAWGNQLGPLMKNIPDLDKVWYEWVVKARELFGLGRGSGF
jgi:hypothetical protein